jgi:hypothetical protein
MNMAKKNQRTDRVPDVAPEPTAEVKKQSVPKYRQCPCCYSGLGGVGRPGWWRRINGSLVKRQYICDKCGLDWTVEERTHSVIESIEYKQVDVQHGRVDIGTR